RMKSKLPRLCFSPPPLPAKSWRTYTRCKSPQPQSGRIVSVSTARDSTSRKIGLIRVLPLYWEFLTTDNRSKQVHPIALLCLTDERSRPPPLACCIRPDEGRVGDRLRGSERAAKHIERRETRQ